MSIYQIDMLGKSLHSTAINRIREFTRGKRVLCAFSGGKDSQACYHLLKDSGVDFHAEYSVTRFEPPELIKFIRANYPDVTFRRAFKMSLISEIELRGLPNMWARWCCAAKHVKTDGFDIAIIGIRWAESSKRKAGWRMFGFKRDKTAYLCPIVEWSDADVWEYLNSKNIPHCSLYDEGYKRIGCVCCPLVPAKMQADAKRWSKIAKMLQHGAGKFVERNRRQGFIRKGGKKCGSWCDAENPEAEYWTRWLLTGNTQKKKINMDEQPCLFDGTGFSENDGNDEN